MVIREKMDFDVLIVGAGPAGLSTAIRLGQLNQERKTPLSVCVIDKGAYIGAHILSGAILELSGLDRLIPDWQQKDAPVRTRVSQEQFLLLTQKSRISLPLLPTLRNHQNYVVSLDLLCGWLAEQAEQLGIHIFPGFAAENVLYDELGAVRGIQTSDKGLTSDRQPGPNFQPGIELYAKQTVFAEGCRGSLSEQLMEKFNLRQNCDPQSYGLGVKEIWEVDAAEFHQGRVIHTVGWPLDSQTYGGGFIYHFEQQRIAVGMIIGLDYKNPYLDPFQELQRFKTHPNIRGLFNNARCISYGARTLNEGGWQSIPKLTFPGGLLIGCGAGFLSLAKMKGNHNAMLSGILAAETISQADLDSSGQELTYYSQRIAESSIYKELYLARNLRPGFHGGLWLGLANAAIDQFIFRGHAPWTMRFRHPDNESLQLAKNSVEIRYPKPDGKITFNKLNQVFLSGTKHRESEPCHLLLKNPAIALEVNLALYQSPEQRYCPAGVYEIIQIDGKIRLQINAANCLHCKACDIKDPRQNIVWTVPEGGDGPNYHFM